MKKTGNNQFLKQYNETMILDLVRINKIISRAELSNITGLSATATGMTITSLIEKGYIHETGIGESKGGRRPMMLELKSEAYYSLGFDIDVDCINMTLIDSTGKIISNDEFKYNETISFENAVEIIENMIEKAILQFSIKTERLLGMGFAVPGMVSSSTQQIVLAPNLGWHNVNFAAQLKKFKDVPSFVENEAMASAICENWIGSCQGYNDFICINIKSGIGAGIFTGGRLYRGASGSAGEVGHISVDENGPKCGCGSYGCLETMSSTNAILSNAKKLVRQGLPSKLNEYENLEDIGIDEIVKAARLGDKVSLDILMESAGYLGIAISNIVNTLNPSKIVLGKEFVKYGDLVLEHIKDIVRSKALKMPASNVEIVISDIGEQVSTLGAAIKPLKALFGK